jgi:hypothetical protein
MDNLKKRGSIFATLHLKQKCFFDVCSGYQP